MFYIEVFAHSNDTFCELFVNFLLQVLQLQNTVPWGLSPGSHVALDPGREDVDAERHAEREGLRGSHALKLKENPIQDWRKKKKNHGFLSFLDCPRCFQSVHFVVLKLRTVFEPFQHSQQHASPGQLTCRQERGRKKCAVKRFWGLTRTQTKLWRICQLLGSLSHYS